MEHDIDLILKGISHDKQTWTFGNLELKLPFAPTIGISLSFNDSRSPPITKIVYNLDGNIFNCHAVHEIEYDDEDLEFWVAKYKKKGWRNFDDLFVSYIEGGVEVKEGVFKKYD